MPSTGIIMNFGVRRCFALAEARPHSQGSKYIPKRLVQKIERMNREKLAVKGILEVLKKVKGKSNEPQLYRSSTPTREC